MGTEKEWGITQEYVNENFYYEDGKLFRKKHSKFTLEGHWEWAITLSNFRPYRRITIYKNNRQKQINIHRLIWIMFNGDIPDGLVIDHINGDSLDNRIENLRCCTQRENSMSNKRNTSGFPGVSYNSKTGKWCAQLTKVINGVQKSLLAKRYDTLEEAVEARRNAERELGIEVREEFFRAS